jgi:hypothetical protein
LGPRFAGETLPKQWIFLRAVKIRSTPSFGGEVKPSAHSREISRYVKEAKEAKINIFLRQFLLICY